MKTQQRGNCQCCGRLQAVVRGTMSKHGYTVDHGWFNGVCGGDKFAPMQVERAQTDQIIKSVRAQASDLRAAAQGLKNGDVLPDTIKTDKLVFINGKRTRLEIPFVEGTDYQKSKAVESAIWHTEQRAKCGEDFAQDMENIANRVHGTPCIVVQLDDAPASILPGEKKTLQNGTTATAKYQEGARVWFTYENLGGQVAKTWMGVQSWRKLA